MINSWQTITSGEESLKPPLLATHFNIFEFRSKPSLITIICMDPHSFNKLIAKKYCFLILLDEQIPVSFSWSDWLIFLFSVISCYFVIINFYPNFVIIIIIIIILFFMKIIFIFSCSGMFWNVPCSGFYQRPLSTALGLVSRRFRSCSLPPSILNSRRKL